MVQLYLDEPCVWITPLKSDLALMKGMREEQRAEAAGREQKQKEQKEQVVVGSAVASEADGEAEEVASVAAEEVHVAGRGMLLLLFYAHMCAHAHRSTFRMHLLRIFSETY